LSHRLCCDTRPPRRLPTASLATMTFPRARRSSSSQLPYSPPSSTLPSSFVQAQFIPHARSTALSPPLPPPLPACWIFRCLPILEATSSSCYLLHSFPADARAWMALEPRRCLPFPRSRVRACSLALAACPRAAAVPLPARPTMKMVPMTFLPPPQPLCPTPPRPLPWCPASPQHRPSLARSQVSYPLAPISQYYMFLPPRSPSLLHANGQPKRDRLDFWKTMPPLLLLSPLVSIPPLPLPLPLFQLPPLSLPQLPLPPHQ
jgi:hypothetical protein